MDIKELDILGSDVKHHWYYRSKAKAMMSLLTGLNPKKILDVGAGSGFFSKHILAQSSAAQAWCVDIHYDADSDVIENEKRVHFRRSIEVVDADLVLLMDVLEHVDNDIGLLRQYSDKVPSGSRFLITVPAFQFLWSGHDEFLDHKRRYTLKQLESVVQSSGLLVTRGVYFFGFLLPIAAALRISQRRPGKRPAARNQLTRHHPFVDRFLGFVCDLELPLMGINRLAGLTVFCLAKKP